MSRRHIDWAALREAFEVTPTPVARLARHHRIPRQQVWDKARAEGWTSHPDRPRRPQKESPMTLSDLRRRHAVELEEALSHDQTRQAVRKALLVAESDTWPFIRDMFSDAVVYEGRGGELYRRSYAVEDATGACSLGEPERVRVEYVLFPEPPAPPAPVIEAGEGTTELLGGDLVIPLREGAVKGGKATILVATPGWGSSGFYSRELLRRDGPKAFPAGTKMFLDHQGPLDRPERSVRELAATLTTPARWEEAGREGPGLYAEVALVPAHAAGLAGIWKEIGVSLNTDGTCVMGEAEGRKGRIVTELFPSPLASIDFVTVAGRGGKVVELIEAAARKGGDSVSKNHNPPAGAPPTIEHVSEMRTGGKHVDEEAKAKIAALEAENKRLSEAATKAQEAQTAAASQLARLAERAAFGDARRLIEGALAAEQGLHAVTRARLVEQLVLAAPIAEGQLDEAKLKEAIKAAVEAERSYLAQVAPAGTGRVEGLGGVQESAAASSDEERQQRLTEIYTRRGMSPEAAKRAAQGRG